jgi:hypothetical protein
MAAGAANERDPLVGRIVGAYRILVRLNELGGLAGYLAEHVHLERRVLLKLLQPTREGGPGALARVIDQARDLSAFRHEGVLPLVEIAECGDGFVFVVLELSGAAPLQAAVTARGPLPWPEVRALGRQVTGALRAAEAASLAGTEIGPAQVYVSMASGREPQARIDLVTPELLGIRAPANPPSQVHAVGRLLYFMLTGHELVGAAGQTDPAADLTLSWPELDIPANADALVTRAIDPAPDHRWADLAVLYHELGGRDDPAGGPTPLPRPEPPSRTQLAELEFDEEDASFGRRVFVRPSRRALLSGTIAVGAAAALACVVLVSRCQRTPTPDSVARPAASPPPPVPPAPAAAPVVTPPAANGPSTPAVAASPSPAAIAPGSAAVGAPDATPPPGPETAAAPRTLALAEPKEGPAKREAGSGEVALGEAPPSCAISLGSVPWSDVWVDGRRAGLTPLTNFVVRCGTHEILFTSVDRGLARRITLSVRPGETAKRIVELAAAPTASEEAGGVAPGGAPEPGGCRLSLGSRPWSEIWIDGRRAGVTPLADLALACGRHDVLFLSRAANVERREAITLQAGQPLKKVVTLVEGD